MSYSFDLFFKQLTPDDDVLHFMTNIINSLQDNYEEYILEHKYLIPSLKSNKFDEEHDNYWLYSLFNLNFIYWPEENLIALVGWRYPNEVKSYFDTHINFQNSTDQDYELDYWSNSINLFKKIKLDTNGISSDELYKYFSENFSKDDIENDYDFFYKSFIYKLIYQELNLKKWLYGENDEKFKRISLNAIDSTERHLHFCLKLKEIVAKF